MTFSKSLAHYLGALMRCDVARVQISLGRELRPGEASSTGVYALMAARKGTILRVSVIHEYAQELADWDSRTLREATLQILPD